MAIELTCESHTCIVAGAMLQNDSSVVLIKTVVKLANAQDSPCLARQ